MPKYRVLRDIEFNGTHYAPHRLLGGSSLPPEGFVDDGGEAPKVRSKGDGKLIPFDTGGEINASESEARPLVEAKAIEPFEEAKPKKPARAKADEAKS